MVSVEPLRDSELLDGEAELGLGACAGDSVRAGELGLGFFDSTGRLDETVPVRDMQSEFPFRLICLKSKNSCARKTP